MFSALSKSLISIARRRPGMLYVSDIAVGFSDIELNWSSDWVI